MNGPEAFRSAGGAVSAAPRRAAAGTTLVEVLVAMVVLGVGLVSVMRAFSTCSFNTGLIRGETVARNFTSQMMAELRKNPALLSSEDEGEVGAQYPGFTWRKELRETDEAGVLAVRITVEWRTRGVRRAHSLVSMVETARF